jgi:hypothetical protein
MVKDLELRCFGGLVLLGESLEALEFGGIDTAVA